MCYIAIAAIITLALIWVGALFLIVNEEEKLK
jgi:hypothetical protein